MLGRDFSFRRTSPSEWWRRSRREWLAFESATRWTSASISARSSTRPNDNPSTISFKRRRRRAPTSFRRAPRFRRTDAFIRPLSSPMWNPFRLSSKKRCRGGGDLFEVLATSFFSFSRFLVPFFLLLRFARRRRRSLWRITRATDWRRACGRKISVSDWRSR